MSYYKQNISAFYSSSYGIFQMFTKRRGVYFVDDHSSTCLREFQNRLLVSDSDAVIVISESLDAINATVVIGYGQNVNCDYYASTLPLATTIAMSLAKEGMTVVFSPMVSCENVVKGELFRKTVLYY